MSGNSGQEGHITLYREVRRIDLAKINADGFLEIKVPRRRRRGIINELALASTTVQNIVEDNDHNNRVLTNLPSTINRNGDTIIGNAFRDNQNTVVNTFKKYGRLLIRSMYINERRNNGDIMLRTVDNGDILVLGRYILEYLKNGDIYIDGDSDISDDLIRIYKKLNKDLGNTTNIINLQRDLEVSQSNKGVKTYFVNSFRGVTNLKSETTGKCQIEFDVLSNDNTAHIQWEPFSFTLASSNLTYLEVPHHINHVPNHSLQYPIRISNNGIHNFSFATLINDVSVDSGNGCNNSCGVKENRLRINLRNNSNTPLKIGDKFVIPGHTVSWIKKN